MNEVNGDPLIAYRLQLLEHAVKELVAQNSQIIAIEERHIETRAAIERAFNAIEKQDIRLRVIEEEMPILKVIRGWVITAVIAVVMAAGAFVWDVARRQPSASLAQITISSTG